MSEYQYYEFRAIDRPLSAEDKKYLRSLSSRAEISSTRFVNHYEWGDFKGDPLKLMHRCFDLHVYYANWGTRTLMLRIADDALDADQLAAYRGETCAVHRGGGGGNHVVVELGVSPDDAGEYEDFDYYEAEDDDSWADQLAPVRELLLAGDLRPPYLAWLAGIAARDEDELEPPVPSGLGDLPDGLASLVEFLGVDADVLTEAARKSPAITAPGKAPPSAGYGRWIADLPSADKDAALLQLLEGDAAAAQATLRRRFRREQSTDAAPAAVRTGRTVRDLLRAAEAIAEERKCREAEARRRKAEARAREAAAERKKHLLDLSRRYEAAWQQVESEIARGASRYREAVGQLADLREAAALPNPPLEYASHLAALVERHVKRYTLVKALKAKSLIEP